MGGVPRAVPGKIGNAISFNFNEHGDKLYTNWPGVSGDDPRTVAFWLRLPPVPDASRHERYDYTILSWGTLDGANSEWAVRVTNQIFLPGAQSTLGTISPISTLLRNAGCLFADASRLDLGKYISRIKRPNPSLGTLD